MAVLHLRAWEISENCRFPSFSIVQFSKTKYQVLSSVLFTHTPFMLQNCAENKSLPFIDSCQQNKLWSNFLVGKCPWPFDVAVIIWVSAFGERQVDLHMYYLPQRDFVVINYPCASSGSKTQSLNNWPPHTIVHPPAGSY